MSRARVLGVTVAVVAVVAAMWLTRFDGVNIALAAVATAVVGTLVGHRELSHEMVWPQLPDERRGGHRQEVSQLSWSLTDRDGRVGEQGRRRLRTVAAGRLALVGVDLDDDDAVRAHLGDRAWRTLRATAKNPPTVRALDACLTTLEELEGARHD